MGVPADHLLTAYQIHSPDVIVAREPFSGERPKADAIVTDRPGIAVGASSADCGPVLFADPQARVVGAAHAGWKGALSRRAGKHGRGDGAPRRPARQHRCRARSVDQREKLRGRAGIRRALRRRRCRQHPLFRAVRAGRATPCSTSTAIRSTGLTAAGVTADALDRCTYAEEDLFYSYRRATHRNEADYGRQVSAIVLEHI